jgi:hypothetical protein
MENQGVNPYMLAFIVGILVYIYADFIERFLANFGL